MKTVLVRFKVYNFRSIEESEWIEVSDNTCLIGTNESGKTNLLIALWKLHPANGEPIIPLNDFPRHLYSNYKAGGHEKDIFTYDLITGLWRKRGRLWFPVGKAALARGGDKVYILDFSRFDLTD